MSSVCGYINNNNINNTTANTTTAGSSSVCGLSPSPIQSNAHILSYVTYSRPSSLCVTSPCQSNNPYPDLFFHKHSTNSKNIAADVNANSINSTRMESCLPFNVINHKQTSAAIEK